MPARDRRRPFWSRWRWKDWEVKTRDLDPYEYTAYHRLLSHAAMTSDDLCSIPDDNRRLSRATGLSLKRWLSVRERVLAFFVPDGSGRYIHLTLKEDADKFSDVVAANTSRVNRWLNQGTTGGSTEGQRSKKLEERKRLSLLPLSDSDAGNGSAAPVPVAACIVRNSSLQTNPGPKFWNRPDVQADLDRIIACGSSMEVARQLVLAAFKAEGKS